VPLFRLEVAAGQVRTELAQAEHMTELLAVQEAAEQPEQQILVQVE